MTTLMFADLANMVPRLRWHQFDLDLTLRSKVTAL